MFIEHSFANESIASNAIRRCPDAYAGLQCEYPAWFLAGDTRQLFIYLIIFGSISILLVCLMLAAICWRRARDRLALKREREAEEREQLAQMKNVLNKTLIPVKHKYKHKEGARTFHCLRLYCNTNSHLLYKETHSVNQNRT